MMVDIGIRFLLVIFIILITILFNDVSALASFLGCLGGWTFGIGFPLIIHWILANLKY